jgi:16S rRNA (guanine527-N7)-methyltransferase
MEPLEHLTGQLRHLSLEVPAGATEKLLRLLDELLRWNRTYNLTAIANPVEGIEKHLVDSLTLLPLLTGDERLLDLGSGGGFPGLPLKIARPGLSIVSVDSVAKKINFQRHAARLLGLRGFEPLHARAESLPERPGYTDGFDVVVSRAFASLPFFASLALPCLQPRGRILAMKGAEGERELAEAESELTALGLFCTELRQLRLPASGALRCLLVLQRRQAGQHKM